MIQSVSDALVGATSSEEPSGREKWERKTRWNGFGSPRILASDFNRGDEDETDVTVFYTYSPGCPETPPAYSHGGLPADPPEVEILAAFAGETEVDLSEAEEGRMALWCIENPPEDDE